MAYANFRAPEGSTFPYQPLVAAAEIKKDERIAAQRIGADLQKNQARIDADIEIAKINRNMQERIAKFRAGWDAQLKQLGIDSDILIAKLGNMNRMEVADYNAKAARMLEELKSEKRQAEIVKQFQVNLKLHQYDSRQALLRTFNETMGDIFKTGNPLDNAADAALYAIWCIAVLNAWNGLNLHRTVDSDKEDLGNLDDVKDVIYLDTASDKKNEVDTDALLKALQAAAKGGTPIEKGGQQNKGKERDAKPSIKTKTQMLYNQRAGQPQVYQRDWRGQKVDTGYPQ